MSTSVQQIRQLEKIVQYEYPEFRMTEKNCAGGINKPYFIHNGEKHIFKSNTEMYHAAYKIIL